MVGEPDVLVDQPIDVGLLPAGGAPSHLQHVGDDPVGALAVVLDQLQVAAQVLEDLADLPPLIFVQAAVLVLLHDLLDLLEKLRGHLGEVLDEVERVLDLVGDPGRQLAQRRELLAHHDLVLGLLQVDQHDLQLLVLLLQFVRQLLDQVQPLHLQRVPAEDLEGGSHVRDLVLAADPDLGFQVAVRHLPHAAREGLETAYEQPSDEQPTDEDRSGNAHDVERQEQRAPGANRLGRGQGRLIGAAPGSSDQTLHVATEFDRQILVLLQQRLLPIERVDFLPSQVEGRAALRQHLTEERLQPIRGRGLVDRAEGALDTRRRRLVTLLDRLDQRPVGQDCQTVQELVDDRDVLLKPHQHPVTVDLRLREVDLTGCGRLLERPEAGHRVEELIVESRHQKRLDPAVERLQFRPQRLTLRTQFEALGDRLLDRRYVPDELLATRLDAQNLRGAAR